MSADVDRPSLLPLPTVRDARGQLAVAELGPALPFRPVRLFVLSDVPAGAARAQHANRSCAEVLICVSGSCVVDAEDAAGVLRFHLAGPQLALVVPAGVWLECRDFSADASLLVLADQAYDPANQITDRAEFAAFLAEREGRAEPGENAG